MNDAVTINRAPRDSQNPYFMQRRATAQDERLSYEARGVLSYLLSKPGDWQIRVGDLQTEHCGRDKVYRILRELKQCGYLVGGEKYSLGGGRWGTTGYELYEAPVTEKPNSVQPNSDLQETIQNEDLQNRDSAPDGAEGDEDTPDTPPAKPKKRAPNPMYDAIFDIWGYSDSMNGAMAKMLTGVATKPQWKDGNISPPMTPEDVRAWAAWYRRTEQGDDPDLNMLEERMKIQSSVNAWRAAGCPTGVASASEGVEYANGGTADYWGSEYGERVRREAREADRALYGGDNPWENSPRGFNLDQTGGF